MHSSCPGTGSHIANTARRHAACSSPIVELGALGQELCGDRGRPSARPGAGYSSASHLVTGQEDLGGTRSMNTSSAPAAVVRPRSPPRRCRTTAAASAACDAREAAAGTRVRRAQLDCRRRRRRWSPVPSQRLPASVQRRWPRSRHEHARLRPGPRTFSGVRRGLQARQRPALVAGPGCTVTISDVVGRRARAVGSAIDDQGRSDRAHGLRTRAGRATPV